MVVESLSEKIGLRVCQKEFQRVIKMTLNFNWTRDPFDRLITAHASLDQSILVTKDRVIREHYEYGEW